MAKKKTPVVEVPLPDKDTNRNQTLGYTLLLIGLYFLLRNLGVLHWGVFQFILQFWPILIIAWGLKILNR